ncbi:MAG: YciI family protein [Ornithinimicrobium sp.]
MTTYAVRYTYSEDTAGRDEHRPAHRDFLGDLATDGALLLSGPFPEADPAGALLLLEAKNSDEVRELLREDPLQQQGLVEHVEILEWTPVRGRWLDQLT